MLKNENTNRIAARDISAASRPDFHSIERRQGNNFLISSRFNSFFMFSTPFAAIKHAQYASD